MDWRAHRITQELQKHDKGLFAKRVNDSIQVWRLADHWAAADLEDGMGASRPTHFVLALTDNWQLSGRPVDWGLQPVWDRIIEMDQHQKASFLDEMRKDRERAKEARKRSQINDVRARAADMRKEFAQATNDINTSTLEKIDNRRTKWL